MNWLNVIPQSFIPKTEIAPFAIVVGRAEQDWRQGLSIDENPYPPGTVDHKIYHDTFDLLIIEETKRDLSAP